MNGTTGTTPKNILISGAAKGIGRCLARTFLQREHKVFILDIDEEEVQHTVYVHLKEYSGEAGRLTYAICDLRDVSAIRAKAREAADWFGGRIDVLINNGGIASPQWKDGKSIDDPSVMEEWQAYVDTNLTAPFALSSACIPYMKVRDATEAKHVAEAGPVIVHVGSFRALQSDANQEGYAATKAGVLGLMHSMAVTCKQWGIRVNLVAPGRIKAAHESKEGDEKGASFEESLTEDDTNTHLSNRAGRPMDIFLAVEYFVNCGFVTGQDLTIDGGVTRKKK